MAGKSIRFKGSNPYQAMAQGRANAPQTVLALLKPKGQKVSAEIKKVDAAAVFDRLVDNCPRIAIIGGSADHPCHINDHETTHLLAQEIWLQGGVPFYFSLPTACDGMAIGNLGMSYFLSTRNQTAELVVNQMEMHAYHSAIVLAGCNELPFGVLSGLGNLDTIRQQRSDPPIYASFIPAPIAKTASLTTSLKKTLQELVNQANQKGLDFLASDLQALMEKPLSSRLCQVYHGTLRRVLEAKLLDSAKLRTIEKDLALALGHSSTAGCSSACNNHATRLVLSALGLVHPSVEIYHDSLPEEGLKDVVQALFKSFTTIDASVSHLLVKNAENTIRVHSTTGSPPSTIMHIVSALIYSGYRFDLWDYQRIRTNPGVPSICVEANPSGTSTKSDQPRSVSELSVNTILKTLLGCEVPVTLNSTTISGTTWKERLEATPDNSVVTLSGDGESQEDTANAETASGVEILRSNFFDSGLLNLGGIQPETLAELDEKVFYVLYFENELDACKSLMTVDLLGSLKQQKSLSKESLLAMVEANQPCDAEQLEGYRNLNRSNLFDKMIAENLFKVALVISGQGPEGFGMPSLSALMDLVDHNQRLRRMSLVLTDGCFSAVHQGLGIGFITPEAYKGGQILYLKTGDMLRLQVGVKRVELLNPQKARQGKLEAYSSSLDRERYVLGTQRQQRMEKRRDDVSPCSRLENVTDTVQGIVPERVARAATRKHPSKQTSYRIRNTRRAASQQDE